MQDKLEKAGVNTGAAQLAVLACEMLKDKTPAAAIDGFVAALTKNAGHLMELMGIKSADVRATAYQYLRERANDMAGKPVNGGASQISADSHRLHDRPSGHRASPRADASQQSTDRPVTARDRPSHQSHASPMLLDRPVAVRPHNRGAPTKIGKRAAVSVASSGIFARKIGYGERTLGTMTKFDFRQLERQGIAVSHVAKRFLTEVEWPDEQRTTLQDCVKAEFAQAIMDSGHRVLDQMGITNVRQ